MRNFRKYKIWEDAVAVTSDIYNLCNKFPAQEKFGLTNQIERAAVSIASNIAEGSSRVSEVDFARYLEISLGSAFEVETQLTIASNIGYVEPDDYTILLKKLNLLQKQINQFIIKLRQN
jgi:four helix bundle protein